MNVLLFSGGMDSTALLLAHPVDRVWPVFFDYDQPHLAHERRAARAICEAGGYPLQFVDLPSIADPMGDGHVVPGRNAIFLSIAVNIAESIGADRVLIGCTREDRGGFPDCRREFIRGYNELLKLQRLRVRIDAPLTMSSKSDVRDLIIARGGDPALTWSCYYPDDGKPCGACAACVVRGEL